MKNNKALQSIISKLEDEKEKLETLLEKEEAGRDDLQGKYDNRSEKWQDSDAGGEMYEKIEKWSEEIGNIEEAINELDSSIMSLGNIEAE